MARFRPASRQFGRPDDVAVALPHRSYSEASPSLNQAGSREVGLDERMDDLVDQRAAAGPDVHEQRLVLGTKKPYGVVGRSP